MARSKSTQFDESDLLNRVAGEEELADRLPDTWDVTEFTPDPNTKSVDFTLAREDGALIEVDSQYVAASEVDGHDGRNNVVVHTVEFAPVQGPVGHIATADDGHTALDAAEAAVDVASDYRETALCDRSELKRRLFLYLGQVYGEDVEAQQRLWDRPGNNIGPIEYLADYTGCLPVTDHEDLQDAVDTLAENVFDGSQHTQRPFEELTTEDGQVVALARNHTGEVVKRAPDATFEDFRETRLDDESAFREAVLHELCERFGDHFEEEVERMDEDKHSVVCGVANSEDLTPPVGEAGVEQVAVALGERVFERLTAGRT